MALPTFNFKPDFTTTYRVTPRVSTTRLGDSFTYRVPVGFRPNIRRRTLRFTVRKLAEIQPIIDFLEAQEGHRNFYWTPPAPDNRLGLWVAPTWNVAERRGPLYDLIVQFEEQ